MDSAAWLQVYGWMTAPASVSVEETALIPQETAPSNWLLFCIYLLEKRKRNPSQRAATRPDVDGEMSSDGTSPTRTRN